MNYRVELGPRARSDLDAAYAYAARSMPASAANWLCRFEAAIATLGVQPNRCGLAPEGRRFARELRQLLFGRRQYKYRAVYYVDGDLVHVIRIRRASMRSMKRSDLDESG